MGMGHRVVVVGRGRGKRRILAAGLQRTALGGPRMPSQLQRLLLPELWVLEARGQGRRLQEQDCHGCGSGGSNRGAWISQV